MDSLPTLDLSELADLVAEARAADVDGAESGRMCAMTSRTTSRTRTLPGL